MLLSSRSMAESMMRPTMFTDVFLWLLRRFLALQCGDWDAILPV